MKNTGRNDIGDILNSFCEGYLKADTKGRIIKANRTIAEMCGYTTPEEMVGITMETLYAVPQERKEILRSLEENDALTNFEVELKRKDGTTFWSLSIIKHFYDEEGQVLGTEGLIRDYSEIRQVKENLERTNTQLAASEQQLRATIQQLAANEQQLRAANQQLYANEKELQQRKTLAEHYLNVAAEIILTLDKNGDITMLNRSGHQLLGYKNGALIGKNWFTSCLPEKNIKEIRNVFKQTLNGQLANVANYESDIKTKTGEIRTIFWHNTVLKDTNGVITAVLSSGEDITDLKRAERERWESDARFRIVQDMSPDGFTIFAPVRDDQNQIIDFTWVYQNTAVAKFNGTYPQDVSGKSFLRLFPGIKGTQFWNTYIQVAESGEPVTFEDAYSGESMKTKKWFRITVVPMDENIAILAHEITDRKQAEEALEHSHELMRYIIEHANSAVAVHDKDMNYVYVSQSYLDQYKITDKNIIGKNHYDVIPDLPQKWRDVHKRVLKGEVLGADNDPYEDEDGNIEWTRWECRPWYNAEGDVNGLIVYTEVVTEEKKMRDAIIESEYKVRSMFENTQIGILYCDTKGNILEINPVIVDILGSPSAEATKKINLLTFKPLVEIGFAQSIEKCIAEKEINTGDTVYTTKLGKTIYMKYYLVPVVVKQEVVGVWVNLNNLTDLYTIQKQLEVAKEKAEENDRLKSAFLANMSHEIRTPMNGILGFTNLLKEPEISPEKRDHFIQIINKSGERMLNTVNDIIDISKIDSGQVELMKSELNIREEIVNQVEFFTGEAAAKGLELKLLNKLPEESTMITDPVKLNSILSNLLKNAIKYTDKGSIEILCRKKGTNVEIRITDTGIGIAKNRLDAVFNRFEQADVMDVHARQGSGLGLSIAKAYVEMLGGTIGVDSEPGKGSSFYFTLPWQENTKKAPSKTRKEEPINISSDRRINILIAEDDDISFEHLEIILEPVAKRIERVTNGKEAIAYVKQNTDTELILMDAQMPLMNGYQATAEIRKFNKEVVIIAQTAYALQEDREEAIKSGCSDYIAKPIRKEGLYALIKKHI